MSSSDFNNYAAWKRAAQTDGSAILTPAPAEREEDAGKILLAFCAAMCLPGLGHAIAGRRKRGLWWLNGYVVLATAFLIISQRPRYLALMGFVLPAMLIVYIWQMIDAARGARSTNRAMLHIPAARYAVSIPLLLGAFAWQRAAIVALTGNVYEVCYSPTPSMEPAICVGDLFLNLKGQTFTRWDAVALMLPPNAGMQQLSLLKRVVGLPGETVEITPDGLTINGKLVPNPPTVAKYYAVDCWNNILSHADPQYAAPGCWGHPVTLGPDEYFLLGDNNRESADSRYWGSVDGRQRGALPKDRIKGRIGAIIWPPNRWRVFRSDADN